MAAGIPLIFSISQQIKKDFEYFQKVKADGTLTENYLRAIRQDLENNFKTAVEHHNEMVKSKANEKITAYLESSTYNDLRYNYFTYWAAIDTILVFYDKKDEDSVSHNETTRYSHKPFKLPNIKIPKFSGKYTEWSKFHKLFVSLIHENTNLDITEKFSYLQTNVEGEAQKLIEHLGVEEANYENALKILTERYSHKKLLVFIQLSQIFKQPVVIKESTDGLKKLLDTTKECLLQLKLLGQPVEHWDSILVFTIQEKLPSYSKVLWNAKLGKRTDVPKYSEMQDFLEERFRSLEFNDLSKQLSAEPVKNFHIQSNNGDAKIFLSSKTTEHVVNKISCIFCTNNHYLYNCSKFLKLNHSAKLEFVKKHKICINCLTNTHTIDSCFSKRKCFRCHKRHHIIMHINNQSNFKKRNNYQKQNYSNNGTNKNDDLNENISKQNQSISSNSQPSTSNTFYTSGITNIKLLGTALVKVFNKQNDFKIVRALIDPCSDENYVTDSLIKSLKLEKISCPTVVSVLGNQSNGELLYKANFKIQSMCTDFNIVVAAAITDTITSTVPSGFIDPSDWNHLDGLKLADPSYYEPGKIDLLLGISIYSEIVQRGLIKGSSGTPFATLTSLGWLIRGDTSENISIQSKSNTFHTISNNSLDKQVAKFWELEQFQEAPIKKPEDELCEKLFKESVVQNSDNRFCVKIPFKNGNDPILGQSKQIALRRFINIENKLNKNKELKIEYFKTIQEYLDNGYMIEAIKEFVPNDMQYFLPHHAVIKKSSTTTKVRVVFDASCKTSDGKSLNDHMLIGPKLQKDITEVLFNWRKYPYALSADIARMYLQFWIHPSHYNYQKILWRFSPDDPIKEYCLTTVTFGTSAAPFLAMRLLLHLAEQDFAKNNYPLAVQTIKNEFYVDDLLSGDYSIERTIEKHKQILELLATAKLNIRKWCSNSNLVLENIADDIKEVPETLNIEEDDFKKTLGMFWSPREDIFSFSINVEEFNSNKLTKRTVLSMIARLYDPLGFISPTIMYAKQIMKKIWLCKSDWDSEVNSEIKFEFSLFMNSLEHLKTIKIPRWNNLNEEFSPITLIGFCDASVKGFGAVVYLKNSNLDKPNLVLLTSKTRVAPTKFVSVARLELCGALLLAELLHWCSTLYQRPIEFHAFCDSKIVLSWLNSHASRWKTFVAHRISKIQKFTNLNWHYVNTKLNPADLASRGVLPSSLPECELWWKGPKLSDLNFSSFSDECNDEIEVERNKKICLCLLSDNPDLINYYSSYPKLCSIIGKIVNFPIKIYQKLIIKNPNKKQYYQKRIELLNNPENIIIRLIQKSEFHCEIKNLMKNEFLPNTSKLISLYPFLDGFGILRVGGRLENANLSYEEKHPIILPSHHQQTQNIIRYAHFQTLHGGPKLVWAFLRRKYFILRGQDRIRKILNDCVTCTRFKRTKQIQLMGSLPAPRVNVTRSFLNSGVDYAGPINLKKWKGKCNRVTKSYICVFVCLSTKAIHLELVSDLSSETFIAAFRRFISRRGHCENLYSDNGTNFVGANKLLQNECRKAEKQWKNDLECQFAQHNTRWHFIPPSSPHFGGLWEAGVKSIKTHLNKIIGNCSLTYEELLTILVQIEGVLNSRPLCPVSDDPNNYSTLTPAHFLIGEPIVAPYQPEIIIKNHPLRRWQLMQTLYQQFTKEYKKEYLQRLINRPKWQKTFPQFKVNDLVLLTETNIHPNGWPMARIIEIHPGKDNIVRVVTLKTQDNKIFKRPITKIRLLPVQTDETSQN